MANFSPKKCHICKRTFIPKSSKALFCPGECRDEARRRRGRKATKKWVNGNAEKQKEAQKQWRNENREQDRYNQRLWRENNPERARELVNKRRKLLGGRGYRKHWKKLMAEKGSICGICKSGLDFSDNHVSGYEFDVDHIVPLDKGGETDYNNLQLANPSCNASKSNKGE